MKIIGTLKEIDLRSWVSRYDKSQDGLCSMSNDRIKSESENSRPKDEDRTSEAPHPITIELGSIEADTPRSSIDTQSTYLAREQDSRRSSIDSNASFSTHSHSQNFGSPRLSLMMKSISTPSLLHKPEHLLWGFAQVVGHFVVDPTMVNTAEFAQLKNRTMYRPGGGSGGGGGMLGRPSGTRQQSKIGRPCTGRLWYGVSN